MLRLKKLFLEGLRLTAIAAAMLFLLLACSKSDIPTIESSEAFSFTANDLNGIWLVEEEQFALLTIDGSLPPLLPEAALLYEANKAAHAAGDRMFDRATWCASPGLPRLQLIAYPFEIMVDKYYVSFFYEWNRWARLVDMSGSELEYLYPMSLGIPSGHFDDGGSLVIDTIGLMSETTMDGAGLPHSDDLVMTERFTLLSKDILENHITFEDPNTFSQAWETVVRYKRQHGARIQEHVCLDNIKHGLPAI